MLYFDFSTSDKMLVIVKILGPHMSADFKGRDNDSGCLHLSPRMIDLDLLVPVIGRRYTD